MLSAVDQLRKILSVFVSTMFTLIMVVVLVAAFSSSSSAESNVSTSVLHVNATEKDASSFWTLVAHLVKPSRIYTKAWLSPPAEKEDGDQTPNVEHRMALPLIYVGIGDTVSPIARDDDYQAQEDETITIVTAKGILANDVDTGNGVIRATLVNDVSNGELNLSEEGAFSYTPNPNFNGYDTFTYIATDGTAVSNRATVRLTVNAVNDAPEVNDDEYETTVDTILTIEREKGVLSNDMDVDQDTISSILMGNVSKGTLEFSNDGTFVYTPSPSFFGQDTFSYRATDGASLSERAIVTLTVMSVNDAPVAADDSYEMAKNSTLAIDAKGVLANDEDLNADSLEAVLVDNVSNGSLTLYKTGAFDYTPNPDYVGQDSFTYNAFDGVDLSNLAFVTVTVDAFNGAPVAVNDMYNVSSGEVLRISTENGVLFNDSDPDEEELKAVLVDPTANGIVDLSDNGAFEYRPNSNFRGQDIFTYYATDTIFDSNVATVTISVDNNNSAPRILTGVISFTEQIVDNNVGETHFVVGAYLDNDNEIDIAATDYVKGMVYLYKNNGDGSFEKSIIDPNLRGAYPLDLGDVDQDGKVDLLAAGYQDDAFVWYRNIGDGSFKRIDIDLNIDGPHSIIARDLNEDGHVDFVTSSQNAGTIGWYENDKSLNFTRHVIDDTTLVAKRAEVGDIDGDGDLDVVAASTGIDEIAWYENDGNEEFTKHIIDGKADAAYFVSVAKIDKDEDLDVFGAIQNDNEISFYENDGDGNFVQNKIDRTAMAARAVIPADIDRDGDIDALAASPNDDTVAWHENDGTGSFTKHVISGAADGSYGVFAIDMDHDGDVDVLSARRDDDTVAIFWHFRLHTIGVAQGGIVTIDSSQLRTTDNDDGPSALIYTITSLPESGEIRVDDDSLDLGSTFTQEEVNNGRLVYDHDGSLPELDEFSFTVGDGGENTVKPVDGLIQFVVSGESP